MNFAAATSTPCAGRPASARGCCATRKREFRTLMQTGVEMARRIVWYSLGLMIVGFASGFALREGRLSFMLYHIGGLGAAGFLACASAAIARRKGYDYWRAWLLAFFLPLIVGLVAAYLVPPENNESRPAACGGSVSLALGLIFIAVWALMRRRRQSGGGISA